MMFLNIRHIHLTLSGILLVCMLTDAGAVLKKENKCNPKMKVKLKFGNLADSGQSPMAGDIRIRSISPWNYTIDQNPLRYPSDILQASCIHNFCIKGDSMDVNLNSVAVEQEILVLMRETKNSCDKYRLEKMKVRVGCTCVQPRQIFSD
ncbi:interleukin-17F-like [Protopterus annectens]|uniref:interleukin-17F-like n=1 Tax=Protopterus annectens TaxID=7888 RepID=UPI001CFB5B3A|nr:interleukin-17F-like [Protopterus annectens]